MKKTFLLISILLLSLSVCEQPTEKKPSEVKLPSLTIRNQSSFDLSGVTFSGILFSVQDSNDLPKGRQATRQLKANETGTAYINLTRKDIEISLRISDTVTFTETDTYTIIDSTVVQEVGNIGNHGTLAQIAFQSKIAVDYGGFSIVKNEAVALEESIINISKQNNFIIKNTGVGALNLIGTTPVRVEGEEAGIFQALQPSSQKIESGASLQFAISFSPKAEKTYTATVTINSDDKDGNFTFTVTADGVPPKPIASVYYNDTIIPQNGAINAGEVLITKSEIISIIIKNNGIEALTIDTANISITGTNANAFTKVTNPLNIIPPGIQSAFEIECKPISYEDNNNIAILTIPTNDRSRNPVTVYLLMTVVKGTYTVTFNADGGFPPPAVQSIESGGKVTEPEAMTRTGYTFNGWYKDADHTNRWNFSFDTVTDTTTLYAQWIPVTYTVSYDKNASDALGTMTNIIHTYDVNKNLEINRFIRTGFFFVGWNTREDDQGDTFLDNQNVINLTSTADAVVTLYAIWLQDINNVRVTAVTENSVSLAWDASVGAGGYNIYRASGGVGVYSKINTLTISTSEFIDTGVTPLTMVYYYRVSAVSSTSMEGAQSNPIPSNFIVPGNGLAAKLAWLTSNAISSNIYFVEVDTNEIIGTQTLSYSSRTGITIILSGRETMRTVNLSSIGSLFEINSGVTLILENNIILNGRSDNYSSLVYVWGGGFIMNGGEITGNTANYGSGVRVVNDGSFTMFGGKISGNTANYSGGGVYVSEGSFTMHSGEISSNTASNGGGVCLDTDSSFTMHGGEISGNTANYRGGGVYVSKGNFTMHDGEISGNISTNYYGGGVCLDTDSSFTMYGGEISGNTANSIGGGGVCLDTDSSFTMHGGEISGNTTNSSGGGVIVFEGNFTMYGGKISGNTANYYGGGVYLYFNGSFTMHGGEISGNTANYSGGGVNVGEGSFTMHDGEISGNTANYYGGGVYLDTDSSFTMHGGKISGNEAVFFGGGVAGYACTFYISEGVIYGYNAFENVRNIAPSGASLSSNGAIFQYGRFNGDTFVPSGDLTTTNNTVRVVNGNLVTE